MKNSKNFQNGNAQNGANGQKATLVDGRRNFNGGARNISGNNQC